MWDNSLVRALPQHASPRKHRPPKWQSAAVADIKDLYANCPWCRVNFTGPAVSGSGARRGSPLANKAKVYVKARGCAYKYWKCGWSTHTDIYIYMYIERERERERKITVWEKRDISLSEREISLSEREISLSEREISVWESDISVWKRDISVWWIQIYDT